MTVAKTNKMLLWSFQEFEHHEKAVYANTIERIGLRTTRRRRNDKSLQALYRAETNRQRALLN